MQYEFPEEIRFLCEKCARCCGDTEDTVRHVLMLKTEAQWISKVTAQEISEFAFEISGSEPYVYEMKKTATNGKCCFLKNNRCSIYDDRPIICRFYPFELKNARNKYLFSNTNKCPGVSKGTRLDEAFFKNLFKLASDALNKDFET